MFALTAKNCGMSCVAKSTMRRVVRTASVSVISSRKRVRWKRVRRLLIVAQASGLSVSCTLSALRTARKKVLTTEPGSGSSTRR